MTCRYSDALGLVDPGTIVPATVQELLAYLGLTSAPRPRQEAAITDWLKLHPPGRLMRFTLQSHGFEQLLAIAYSSFITENDRD